ncbi:hypothetical protein PSTG_11714 [Puccinia striiformis f. sp. tritici PST-78]|uniref:Uncharacterized protein n=1 Tax=Puccinia striiformis f. sp. tritici PST-78 TaxID=1165861 RepID=A0A0L0V6M5_9BASI|nr:hypothetical protein PSTG_11714 [Puccinia striiformis f. sp. tritici PST-78]
MEVQASQTVTGNIHLDNHLAKKTTNKSVKKKLLPLESSIGDSSFTTEPYFKDLEPTNSLAFPVLNKITPKKVLPVISDSEDEINIVKTEDPIILILNPSTLTPNKGPKKLNKPISLKSLKEVIKIPIMSVIIREPLYNGLLEGPRSQRQVNAALATAALLQLPQCQHLMVYDIWTPITNRTESSQLDQQPARNSVRRMMNTFESLEVLMSFFEETIVEPDLEFITSFWLPAWTIELIGRIQNLLILRLALKSEWHSGDPSPMSSGNDKLLGLTDPHKFNGCLGLLIGAGQGLEVLDLSQLPLQCLPRSFPNPLPTQPTITQLDIKLTDKQPLDSLISLTRALKPSLKILSIQSFRDDGLRLPFGINL